MEIFTDFSKIELLKGLKKEEDVQKKNMILMLFIEVVLSIRLKFLNLKHLSCFK